MGERVRIEPRAADATSCRWRQCSRCGRCFWLADEERVPPHATSDDPRIGRVCVAQEGASE